MPLHDHILRVITLCQIAVGVLGNSLCLFFCNLAKFTRCQQTPMNTILAQLTLTNAIILLSKGIPQVILYFKTAYFLGKYGCKIVFYIQRVSRGTSIFTTCLLSVYQAVIISPNNSRLSTLKTKIPKYVRTECALCWILTLLMDIYVPLYITDPKNRNSSHSGGVDLQYCYWVNVHLDIVILPIVRDILSIGCMSFASSYMVFLLYRHHQRAHQIHSARLSPRTSPEIKATQIILVLLGTFISTYCMSFGWLLYSVYSVDDSITIVNLPMFLTLCFPTLSPFLLIHNKGNESNCATWWRLRPPQNNS